MANKKPKPDRTTIKKEPVKETPITTEQVGTILKEFAEGITTGIDKSNKQLKDYIDVQINRLDNKDNTIAKQMDHKPEAVPKSPIDTFQQITDSIEKITNNPIFVKAMDRLLPAAPPEPTSVASDPEYIAYVKDRAKQFDDLLLSQLKENQDSLHIKNLQARKELDSDL